MENLSIAETENTPSVDFNAHSGTLTVSGESFPNLAIRFYQPLIDWLQIYLGQNKGPISLNFRLSYFNTSSSKCLINILMLMEGAHAAGKSVEINWYYRAGDRNVKESGEELLEGLTLPYNIFQLEE